MSVALLVAMGADPARATTYVVTPDGSGDFATIQAAIDAAVDGDVIELADGVFAGPGNIGIAYRGKAITVRSAGGVPSHCILEGPSLGESGVRIDEGEGSGSVLSGITVRHCGNDFTVGGGLRLMDSSPTIENCHIVENHAQFGAGIAMFRASPFVTRCVIAGNVADRESQGGGNGGGVTISGGAPVFEDCLIVGNRSFRHEAAGASGGIYIGNGVTTLLRCTIAGNQAPPRLGGGIDAGYGSTVICRETVLWGNCGGDLRVGPAVTVVSFECCVADSSGFEVKVTFST